MIRSDIGYGSKQTFPNVWPQCGTATELSSARNDYSKRCRVFSQVLGGPIVYVGTTENIKLIENLVGRADHDQTKAAISA